MEILEAQQVVVTHLAAAVARVEQETEQLVVSE
jgi:hypothetical protein